LWREAHFEVKMYKTHHSREVEMSKKCTPLWREAHFEVKMYNSWANITGFEQMFLLLVYKDVNAIRWHEHGQIVRSHFETRQPASLHQKRSDEP
jgi:hypothetical protein